MKKAILGVSGLVLFGCLLYIISPYFDDFLRHDGPKLSSEPGENQPPGGGGTQGESKPAPPPDSGFPGVRVVAPFVGNTGNNPPASAPEISAALENARAAEQQGRLVEARNKYSDLYKKFFIGGMQTAGNEGLIRDLLAALDRLNRQIYYDKWNIFEGQEFYTVQPNDNLTTIAKRYGVTPNFIARINGKMGEKNMVRVNEKLKIVKGAFNAVIDISDRKIYVMHGEHYFCQYDASVGRAGRETPLDCYTVGAKDIQPQWTDPDTGVICGPDDPNYPLGSRWISLVGDKVGKVGIGIHGQSGSTAGTEIGQAVSRGCIRLRNEDVEVLYDLLTTGNSKVLIKE